MDIQIHCVVFSQYKLMSKNNKHLFNFRTSACGQCNCGIDKSDPCSICPLKKWGTHPTCNKNTHLKSHPKISFELPTNSQMAKSVVGSLSKWVGGGFKQVQEKEFDQRLSHCKQCEFWNSKGFNNSGRCMKCGCSTWIKLRMATEKCPIGKW
jgi:hypothetical protein